MFKCITSPSKFLVNKILLPSPMINLFSSPEIDNTSLSSSVLLTSINFFAFTSIEKEL